jgi:hypothetical protein
MHDAWQRELIAFNDEAINWTLLQSQEAIMKKHPRVDFKNVILNKNAQFPSRSFASGSSISDGMMK